MWLIAKFIARRAGPNDAKIQGGANVPMKLSS